MNRIARTLSGSATVVALSLALALPLGAQTPGSPKGSRKPAAHV